jgi:hypothetical protein
MSVNICLDPFWEQEKVYSNSPHTLNELKHRWNNYIYESQWTEASVKQCNNYIYEGQWTEASVKQCFQETVTSIYLLSEMYICVYNAWHINRNSAITAIWTVESTEPMS